MKKNRFNNQGFTFVEPIMVMTLMLLFGVTMYTLIYAGSETQQRIVSEKNAQVNARIALSYLNVRLRQNDARDKIWIEKNSINGQDSIVIKERDSEWEYDLWIYWSDGVLRECWMDADVPPDDLFSYEIVSIDGFETRENDDGSVSYTVTYDYNGQMKTLSSLVYLRSHSPGGGR